MPDKVVFLVRSSFFSRSKLLTITPEYISIGLTDSKEHNKKVEQEDVESFRYTARRVRYYLYLYNYYKIDIRGGDGEIISIRLISLFGLYKNRTGKKYGDIFQQLYHHYFRHLIVHYLDLFSNAIDFEIAGLIVTNRGIQFSKQTKLIGWADVGVRDYASYFSVFSKNDKYNYKTFDYWNEWNTIVLNTVITSIVKSIEGTIEAGQMN